MYACPTVTNKNVCNFGTKIFYLIHNCTHHGRNKPHIYSDACTLKATELIDKVEKYNTLITINGGTYFCILGFFIQSL